MVVNSFGAFAADPFRGMAALEAPQMKAI